MTSWRRASWLVGASLFWACTAREYASDSGQQPAAAGDAAGSACKKGDKERCYESAEGKSFGPIPKEDVGDCRVGTRTCDAKGAWSACLGAVAPQGSDTCEPGNDANCNGIQNESCDCINGDTQACGSATGNCKKGTRSCADGAWGDCTGGVLADAKDKCDVAGDDSNCNGIPNEGCNCVVGQTQGCAKCGTISCDAATGKWSTTCMDQKDCEPGDEKPELSQPCSYCGEQKKKRVCSDACSWGPVVDDGACVEAECSMMPGDERTGYVICEWPTPQLHSLCLASQKCCLTTGGSYSCAAACAPTDLQSVCDGPEDCPGATCCSRLDPNENSYTYCTNDCPYNRRCHADSDCKASEHCSKYSSVADYNNGICYVNGTNP